MEKIKAQIIITTEDDQTIINTNLNIENNIIEYFEDDEEKTIAIFNLENNTLKRDNLKMYMELLFKEKEETINNILQIKDIKKEMNIPVYTSKIIRKKNYLKIIYNIDKTEFIYEIKIDKNIHKNIL